MKRILVLTDFSPASERALAQAEALARAFGAELHLFTKVVYPPPQPPTELLEQLTDADRFDYVLKEVLEKPEREAREALDARAADLRGKGLDVATLFEQSGEVFARAEAAIASVKPDLLVMGTHGRSGVKKWLLGSLAEKMLRHAPVDVLTVHESSPVAGSDDGLGVVLVATDFSACSARALDTAYRFVSALGGSILLLHVMEPRFRPIGAEGEVMDLSDELRTESESALRDALGGREGTTLLSEGNVAVSVDRLAREKGAGLIVQGTHGRGGLRRALIGSVAERVARLSTLPVLTVR